MSFNVPSDRHYLESHEWAEPRNGRVRIGITDFAQDELGDIVFVELPSEGEEFEAGDQFGTIESIKTVSDLYVHVSGSVVAVNECLENQPELVNEDPYGDGWMIEVEFDDESQLKDTLSSTEYREQTA